MYTPTNGWQSQIPAQPGLERCWLVAVACMHLRRFVDSLPGVDQACAYSSEWSPHFMACVTCAGGPGAFLTRAAALPAGRGPHRAHPLQLRARPRPRALWRRWRLGWRCFGLRLCRAANHRQGTTYMCVCDTLPHRSECSWQSCRLRTTTWIREYQASKRCHQRQDIKLEIDILALTTPCSLILYNSHIVALVLQLSHASKDSTP